VSDEERDGLLEQIQARYKASMDPRYAAARLWVDEIIDPRSTREVLARSIAAAAHRPVTEAFKVGVLQT
jgi:acetyl-CoA carboxylase carboxyltransferase component